MHVNEVKTVADRIRAEIGKAVIGQDGAVDLLLTALLAGGHVLLEGPPGTAKTLLAHSFARSVGLDYGRIQFTPDLMPGDIIGSNLFNFQTSSFTLTRGPIFCELLLADEINRTPPKTQAALLEAMQERQITIDGQRHALGDRFIVVATQNPIEQQGTYPLPEAQLDRFLFKHVLSYPTIDQERAIIAAQGTRTRQMDPVALGVEVVADGATIDAAATAVAGVRLTEEVVAYTADLIRATRDSADVETGASPRAGAMLAAAARARAALDGRDYVIPDDVKVLALPALRHRVLLSPSAEIEGRRVDQVLAGLVERVAAPR
ncbi:AAA family ATPase [Brevundimonas subvibrioides]|uniref:ATPase associated with various cellular activities AAA_3 n=1 Tax=Brevundimonas subvibrioides (strain ATCC 15264 / DSM 4735 / LMG 14903 / NBRC 16000 / CB 81) TaxID=633149 RepID=D9QH97_BRESC|nr:AAA family ATPase [Brevundimonas subvibrioides]ADL01063.1 ATPase associated with various cellular activities AAA_3 [Brevundimonas subvibrioides ATCC 15264]